MDARGQDLNGAGTPDELQQRQREFDAARTPVLIAGAAGSALTLAGTALLTSQVSEDVPWWTWVVGGAGVVVATIGVALMATDGACYGNTATTPDGCARRSPTWLLGALVLEHAAPLLAVPITAWIQSVTRTDPVRPAVTLRVDADRLGIAVSGWF
ncbi:MAG: hypothetical protein M3Y87_13405 [Myxococcota bacterium]|nr:hypothetical protein [Myxococcota bacterium]